MTTQTRDLEVSDRIVARHPRNGWITLDARLTTREGAWQTTEHETVTDPFAFAASGAMWLRRNSRDCHTAGQMLDALVAPGVGPVGQLTSVDLVEIHRLWSAWHLNDVTAGCAHQTVVWETVPYRRPSLELTPRCPLTGYKYGSAWLLKPIPADEVDAIRHIMAKLVTCPTWPDVEATK